MSSNKSASKKHTSAKSPKTPKVSHTKVAKSHKAAGANKAHKRHRDHTSFSTGIHGVLKQVHPDTSIGIKAMNIVNSLVKDAGNRIGHEANRLAASNKRNTVSQRDVKGAVKIVFGEHQGAIGMAKHAEAEMAKAITQFNAHETGDKKHHKSASKRAGLRFRPGKNIRAFLLNGKASRVGATAVIGLTAVLEYLAAEVLELSGNAAKHFKAKRISPRYIKLAMSKDQELNRLFHGTIAAGGVTENVHAFLIPKKHAKKHTSKKGGSKKTPSKKKPSKKTSSKKTGSKKGGSKKHSSKKQ